MAITGSATLTTRIALRFLLLIPLAWVSVAGNAGQAAELMAAGPAQLSVALDTAAPGDRIVMADGIWQDRKIVFRSRGTLEQPITLCAQTPGKVILNGESSLQIGGTHLIVEGLCFKGNPNGPGLSAVVFMVARDEVASHCRLTQCAIIDYSPPDKNVSTCYVHILGLRNRVDHCYFRGKTNQSATLMVNFDPGAPPNYHVIDHNYFAYRPPLGVNGAESIQVGWSAAQKVNSRTFVEYNYFEECNGEAEIIANKSCENIYRYNTFRRCLGVLSLRVGDRCLVKGNYFFGENLPETGGIHVFGEDHKIINNYLCGLSGTAVRSGLSLMNGTTLVTVGEKILAQDHKGAPLHPPVKRAVIAFNTFVDCEAPIDIGVAYSRFANESKLVPADCVLANNLLQCTRPGPIVKYSSTPINISWFGNLGHGGSIGISPSVGINNLDPKLAMDADGLWRPAADSKAIGSAEGIFDYVNEDIDGQPRPATGKDVGCDQSSPAPVKRHPLTPRDVGPAWLTNAIFALSGHGAGF